MVALPQPVWAKGSGLCLLPPLSALLGDVNGSLGPEQKPDHGSMGGTNELSLGNGSQKERAVWGSIVAHLGPEREGT